MTTAARIVEADRRRAILAALSVAPAYRLPLRTLRAQLDTIGYAVTLDRLRTDCAWLEEQGLATVTNGESAALTDRGTDIVMGRCEVPGVRRPEPGEL